MVDNRRDHFSFNVIKKKRSSLIVVRSEKNFSPQLVFLCLHLTNTYGLQFVFTISIINYNLHHMKYVEGYVIFGLFLLSFVLLSVRQHLRQSLTLKFKELYTIKTHRWIQFIFGLLVHVRPRIYSVVSPFVLDPVVKLELEP